MLEQKNNDIMVLLVSYIVSSIVKFFSFEISFPLKSILYYFFFYFGTCMAKRTKPIEKTVERAILIISGLVAVGSWSICILERLLIHKIPVAGTFVGLTFCIWLY